MKKLFFMIVAAGLTLTAAAQKTEKQVATLQHGNQTMVFYGIDAFVQAYNAAADTLDVITLSGGEFNVPNQISKSLAIYGAGCENDSITGAQRTYLSSINLVPADGLDGDGLVKKAEKKVNGVYIEGIYTSSINAGSNNDEPIHNLSIVKCKVESVSFGVDCYDCVIRQSIITKNLQRTNEGYYGGVKKYAHNLLISNCYIAQQGDISYSYYVFNFSNTSTILIDHCIIKPEVSSACNYAQFRYTNNIIYLSSLPVGADGLNNIFVYNGGESKTDSEDGSWYNMRDQGVWADENEDGTYAAYKTFELKYPARYIGTDGTEIGVHGGVYAWNKIPVIPRITECSIDTKDVNNGTLKVSIKAEAQTKE